jgi:hypothetical protein
VLFELIESRKNYCIDFVNIVNGLGKKAEEDHCLRTLATVDGGAIALKQRSADTGRERASLHIIQAVSADGGDLGR